MKGEITKSMVQSKTETLHIIETDADNITVEDSEGEQRDIPTRSGHYPLKLEGGIDELEAGNTAEMIFHAPEHDNYDNWTLYKIKNVEE